MFSQVRSKKILREVRFTEDAKLVKCAMDEMIGIAFATGLPIVIPDSVYEALNVDGLLEKKNVPGNADGRLVMASPHFASADEEKAWRAMKMQVRGDVEAKRKRAAKLVPKAMEIKVSESPARIGGLHRAASTSASISIFLMPSSSLRCAAHAGRLDVFTHAGRGEARLPARHGRVRVAAAAGGPPRGGRHDDPTVGRGGGLRGASTAC